MFKKQGLYDPVYEHDVCGVGFVCHIGDKRHWSVLNKKFTGGKGNVRDLSCARVEFPMNGEKGRPRH